MAETEWLTELKELLYRNVFDPSKPGKERLEAWAVAQNIEALPEDTNLQRRVKEVLKRNFTAWVSRKGWLVPDEDPFRGLPQSALVDDGTGRSTPAQRTEWRNTRIARVKHLVDVGYITDVRDIRTFVCSVEEAKECLNYLKARMTSVGRSSTSESKSHQYQKLALV